jgi:hypothetical protein
MNISSLCPKLLNVWSAITELIFIELSSLWDCARHWESGGQAEFAPTELALQWKSQQQIHKWVNTKYTMSDMQY